MEYEADPFKAASNIAKHGISFGEAVTALLDPNALAMEDDSADESRWVLLGLSEAGRLLTVVYAMRGDVPRMISARRATAREKKAYEI
ncbi:BrnT family toxin [Dyella jejuensis]|uniref:BrnT family toxin n=1 Tax=Dyella jejuensis TaxID=1432009 RepID=A0ABW8JF60_9GAMM